METPCRYVEAFNEATSHLESHLESLLAKNFSELEEKRRILAQLEKSEPERVKVKERLSWLLHQEAKLQEALAEGTTCSRCKVLPNAATKVFGCSNGHLTCQECLPDTNLSLASCSTCGEAVDKRSLLAATAIGLIRKDCRHAGCFAPYHPALAYTHTCQFVRVEKEIVTADQTKDPLLKAQQRVSELEAIIKQTEKIHQEAVGELNKDLCPVSLKTEEVETVESELQAIESKLADSLECPVCWEIATEGLLHCCPNGHLVCETCYQSITKKTDPLCPSCRVPMGSNISLLASVIQQNIRYVCDCGERIPFQQAADHKRMCVENKAHESITRKSPHALNASVLDSKVIRTRQDNFDQRGEATVPEQQLVSSDQETLVQVQITLPTQQGNPQSQPRELSVMVRCSSITRTPTFNLIC